MHGDSRLFGVSNGAGLAPKNIMLGKLSRLVYSIAMAVERRRIYPVLTKLLHVGAPLNLDLFKAGVGSVTKFARMPSGEPLFRLADEQGRHLLLVDVGAIVRKSTLDDLVPIKSDVAPAPTGGAIP